MKIKTDLARNSPVTLVTHKRQFAVLSCNTIPFGNYKASVLLVNSYFEKRWGIKCTRQAEGLMGCFEFTVFQRNFERIAGEAMDMCL